MGSVFVLAISAWYLLRGRNAEIARRAMAVAASFGLACSISVVVLGDESGYLDGENQKMKVASIEAEWKTEPPPASFTAFGLPDVAALKTHSAIKILWALGLIATRSIDRPVLGIFDLVARARARIVTGMEAYSELQLLRARPNSPDPGLVRRFEAPQTGFGYGVLLPRYPDNPAPAPPRKIAAAGWSPAPHAPRFFSRF